MDILQQEINRKRQALAQDNNNNGKKYFKRSDIEKKRLQRLKQEEQQSEKLENSSKNHPSTQDPNPTHQSNTPEIPNSKPESSTPVPETDSYKNLPKHELFRRLRILKQPVTLFGEDDESRLERFRFVLKTGTFEVDDDMTEGQTNDFLRDIVELKRRQKSGIDRKRKKDDGEEDGERRDEDLSGDEASSGGIEHDKDLKRMKAGFEDLCDEDKILVFFKKLLNEWNQELDEMGELERRTAKGKSMVATFKQCARYLTPLFKFCRKKVLPDDIRLALIFIVQCCNKRDYLAAMDQYIKLAIGNAPWPIGVTMVGIHERSAREKIHTNSVAHIMNDETTRKYLQSIKRLMTFAQRRYPTMPSKAVEFNSLANGSDLQSLLAEERVSGGAKREEEKLLLMMPGPNDGGAKRGEEKLLLMPAPKDE